MAKSFVQELGERLASVESRLSSLSSGNRLDHASLDGTTLYLRDYDGNLSGRLGRQPDGSNGVHVVRVQPPPQLTAALLTVGEQAGTCLTEWDGNTFDGRRMPLIHGHTEIWAELVGDDWSPTVAPGEPAKRVGTIRDRTGGEVVVALPQAGTWAVWLRAMGADRETAGPWSPVSTVEVAELVNTENIQDIIASAVEHIEEATDQLADSMGQLGDHLTDLRDVRIPQLEATLAEKASSSQLDAISNGVAALTGTNAKTFTQATEPPAMTGAVTYEWTGEPHASESIKRVDGVEVARNLITNPSFELGVEGVASSVTANHSHIWGGNVGSIGGYAMSVEIEDASISGGWVRKSVDIEPVGYDRWGGFSTVARNSIAMSSVNHYAQARQDGDILIQGYLNSQDLTADLLNERPRLVSVFQVPAGTNEMRIWLRPGHDVEFGRHHTDAWVASLADTEAEALAQVETYFDGDSPDEPAESGLWINTAEDDTRYWWDHEQAAWVEVQDDAVFNRVVTDRIFSNLGVFDRLEAREGWIGGVALENGAVKSRTVDTEEFFAAEAVIQKVWTDIVRSRLIESQGIITEDMIATGAITTPKLTVTEEMVGEVAKLIRIEAGSLASNDIEAMRIVSSLIEATTYLIHNSDGDVSVRLDGVDNFIAGELNTFATPAERDAQLGPNVTLGTSASTVSPTIDWRREQDEWVPAPGAWKLDEIDFSNMPTDDPIPLNIPPALQGQFSRYEIIIRAGVVEGGFEAKALMVLPNSEWGTGLEQYRAVARAEEADGTIAISHNQGATGWPQMGHVGPYNGHLQINFQAIPYGDTRYMTWDTTGWVNMGGGSFEGGYLVRSGGRWGPPNPVPLTHFGIRPALGADRTWYSTSLAELWGYR